MADKTSNHWLNYGTGSRFAHLRRQRCRPNMGERMLTVETGQTRAQSANLALVR